MDNEKIVLGTTESVCPVCLRRIKAGRVAEGENVFLIKTCPEHGRFKTIIWRGQPSYQSWTVPKKPSQPPVCNTSVQRGCPFDCGLCPEHRQHSCCVLLEVTQRCDLLCPFCFASSGRQTKDPGINEIEGWYRTLLAAGGPYNIQLSGGEPTLRDDLPEIIALGRSLGYQFFQLNTNGLRLARESDYAGRLKQAGLACVFLQFDGTRDEIYKTIRGKALFDIKKAVLDCCAAEQLGVVLVPTLVPGINTENIGEIIQFAMERMPVVRGVHFQPVSYFGRYPQQPADDDRITIPEVIREIQRQTKGVIKASDFRPPAAENAYCSFHGNFVQLDDGTLMAWADNEQRCCGQVSHADEGARKARKFVARHWAAPKATERVAESCDEAINVDSLDAFIERVQKYSLSISGMAFQDAWNLDLERLRDCFIHVAARDNRIIPFCAYNLTDKAGLPLYRQRG